MSVRVRLDEATVVVTLTGPNRLFALKGRLEIPRSQITTVEVMTRTDVPYVEGTWLRAPGTYVPGLIKHGSYGATPHREFWAVFRQVEVLVIGVVGGEYSRLILATADPRGDSQALGEGRR